MPSSPSQLLLQPLGSAPMPESSDDHMQCKESGYPVYFPCTMRTSNSMPAKWDLPGGQGVEGFIMSIRGVQGGGETGSCGELGWRALPLAGLQLLHHLLVGCLVTRLEHAAHHCEELVVVWRRTVALLGSLQPCYVLLGAYQVSSGQGQQASFPCSNSLAELGQHRAATHVVALCTGSVSDVYLGRNKVYLRL